MKRTLYTVRLLSPISFVSPFFCLLLLPAIALGCKRQQTGEEASSTKLYNIASSDSLLDQATLSEFCTRHDAYDSISRLVADYYKKRNYRSVWMQENSEQRCAMYAKVLHEYLSFASDSSIVDSLPAAAMAFVEKKVDAPEDLIGNPAHIDVSLTLTLARMLSAVYEGKPEIVPLTHEWHIKHRSTPLISLIDSLIHNPSASWLNLDKRRHPQCDSLFSAIRFYQSVDRKGGFKRLPYFSKKLSIGGKAPFVVQLKRRLSAEGLYSKTDTTPIYSNRLATTIRQVRASYALGKGGRLIDSALIRHLNQPASDKLLKLRVNYQRFCWLPYREDADSIVVNIPAYHLDVYESGDLKHNMTVVVGKKTDPTKVFRSRLRTIVFSPYWYVPHSIVKKEIMPAIAADTSYLTRHRMEIIGKAGGLPLIRQRPGPANSLGKVKFLFPNDFGIYLHDTPAKRYFDYRHRAFSHGCVRLSRPDTLANYLLRKDSRWDRQKIDEAMNSGEEQTVSMPRAVPVLIVYFTVWADKRGLLQWREDIYEKDRPLAKAMGLIDK